MPSLFEIGLVVLSVVNVSFLFRNYLPLEKGVILHFNKFEFPVPKDALVEIGPVVLKKKIF